MAQPRMILISLVALVMALGAAFLARGLASPRRHTLTTSSATTVVAAKPTIRVLVARRDLAVGDVIGPDSVTWQAWPADAINPRFITDGAARAPAADGKLAAAAQGAANAAKAAMTGDLGPAGPLMGSVVRVAMLSNEPISAAKLVKGGAGGVMAVSLSPGMRAMSVPITAESAAGGFILPGDHVDVVEARKADGTTGQVAGASLVLENVKVLAIDQNTHPSEGKASVIGATGTLEVSPEQARALVTARATGDLTLMLRSYADAQGPPEIGGGGQGESGVVHVYRSGQSTDVRVTR